MEPETTPQSPTEEVIVATTEPKKKRREPKGLSATYTPRQINFRNDILKHLHKECAREDRSLSNFLNHFFEAFVSKK